MKALLFLLATFPVALAAQDLSKLPEWARPPAAAAAAEAPPKDAEAWVLYQHLEIAYTGKGEIRTHVCRLVKILGEKGIREGTFKVQVAGGKAGRLASLKGWNLRPDGDLETISSSDLAGYDPDGYGTVTAYVVKEGALPRVAKGSLVAFESEEVERSVLGPVTRAFLVEDIPVRHWELVRGGGGFFSSDKKSVPIRLIPRHWEVWGLKPENLPNGFAGGPIPAEAEGEGALPSWFNWFPSVEVVFLDPDLKEAPDYNTWDGLAKWNGQVFRTDAAPSGNIPAAGLGPLAGLRAIHAWMAKELAYKQVYLTPARGWVPQKPAETIRRRDGDCKDHANCFLTEAAAFGFQGFPVLCRIVDGAIEPDQPVGPFCFNHVIAALKLEHSLGLPAEVETPGGRFLLVDTTDRFCPLGLLPEEHRGQRVLICTPGGATWVTVPAAAVLQPRIALEIKGSAAATGATAASATLRETGNALFLRATALHGGRDRLRSRLLESVFQLPSSGSLEIVSFGDPLDLEHPFEVAVKAACPDGLTRVGSGLALVPWGLPAVPGSIQKFGKPRQGPVHARSHRTWDLSAEWELPASLQPRLPDLKLDDPFRQVDWHAVVDGSKLRISFHQETRDADFTGDRSNEGVAQWKKDRSQMERMRMDGCSLKPAATATSTP
jgi:hypothetical protein